MRKGSWSRWALMEESKRALWCFYCLVVKSGDFLQHPLSNPEAVNGLDLPCPDALFDAPNEQTWRDQTDSNQYQSSGSVPFQHVLYQLRSADPMCQLVVDGAAKYNSHILLCGLLRVYQSGVTLPCYLTSLNAYLELDMSRFRLHDDLLRALQYWKSLFWRDPYDLWHSSHPDSKVNNTMLWVYTEVQTWRCLDTHPLSPSYRRVAAQLALDILSSIALTGFLEVGAKSPFYVERITYFCSSTLALAMLAWLDRLEYLGNGNITPDADRVQYEKLVDCLDGFPGASDLSWVDSKFPPVEEVRQAVVGGWVLVTGDAKWIDGGI